LTSDAVTFKSNAPAKFDADHVPTQIVPAAELSAVPPPIGAGSGTGSGAGSLIQESAPAGAREKTIEARPAADDAAAVMRSSPGDNATDSALLGESKVSVRPWLLHAIGVVTEAGLEKELAFPTTSVATTT
jgi:hypothetical protein